MANNEDFVIFEYTRAQAIADGVLVDLSQGELGALAREAGIKYPMACTAEVFARYIDLTQAAKKACNDIIGRFWDILTMFKYAVRNAPKNTNTMYVHLRCVVDRVKAQDVVIKSMCHPGDNGEPVITL